MPNFKDYGPYKVRNYIEKNKKILISPPYLKAIDNLNKEIRAIQPDLRKEIVLLVSHLKDKEADYIEPSKSKMIEIINKLQSLIISANPILPAQTYTLLKELTNEGFPALQGFIETYKENTKKAAETAEFAFNVFKQKQAELLPDSFKGVINNPELDALVQACYQALEEIKEEAAANIMGIPDICYGLQDQLKKNPDKPFDTNAIKKVIDPIRGYFNQHVNLGNPKYKETINLIKNVLITHNQNIQELKDSKKPSSPSILTVLDNYLDRRSKVVHTDTKQTKEHYGYFFNSFKKTYSQKKDAVTALKKALNREPGVDLLSHLAVLRNGDLGENLRAFVKAGHADNIVGKQVNTVSDFIKELSKLSPATPPTQSAVVINI
ncbi:hypothetical protein ACNVED_03390 [Legionella sp. D16C41]|uniref:hypothetical protein n=1 Tax=Legionella sp. D16C41 TaxID=3402688 RepID=UPI003AF7BCC6